jgi:hypothetical protein
VAQRSIADKKQPGNVMLKPLKKIDKTKEQRATKNKNLTIEKNSCVFLLQKKTPSDNFRLL